MRVPTTSNLAKVKARPIGAWRARQASRGRAACEYRELRLVFSPRVVDTTRERHWLPLLLDLSPDPPISIRCAFLR